jgi:hypothetical protein
VLCAALALYPLRATTALAAPAVVGSALVLVTLVLAWEQLLAWALAVLGGEYAASLFVHGGPGTDSVPLVGAGLLLLGELVAWSISLRTRMREEPPVLLLRLWTVVLAVAASLAVGAMLVALAATDVGGGLTWTTIGTAAAVGAVYLATAAPRAARPESSPPAARLRARPWRRPRP